MKTMTVQQATVDTGWTVEGRATLPALLAPPSGFLHRLRDTEANAESPESSPRPEGRMRSRTGGGAGGKVIKARAD